MITVCMATYNGEKYIREQITSILKQLPYDSEIVVSDDGSIDNTLKIVEEFKDPRIVVVEGPHKGVVKNFENALSIAKGDVIFLADQDDIWMDNKVEVILKQFEDEANLCVLHDALVVDAKENVIMDSFFMWRGIKHGVINNLIKNSYTGCCMVVRRNFIKTCMPFPENIEMHDWWIGLCAEKKKASVFVNEKLIKYRRHGENTNSLDGYKLKRKITNRINLLKAII